MGRADRADGRRRLELAALLLLVVVTAGAVGAGARGGVAPAVRIGGGTLSLSIQVLAWLGIFLEALVVVAIVYILRPRSQEGEDSGQPSRVFRPPPIPWYVRVAVMCFPVLALAVLLLLGNGHPGPRSAGFQGSGGAGNRIPLLPYGPGTPLSWTAFLIATAIAAAGVAALWRSSVRSRRARADRESRQRQLEGAVSQSLEALRAETDPRRAVIAAYAAMERALAVHSLGRRQSEAPGQYLQRVLGAGLQRSEEVATLAHSFEIAKFSRRPIGAEVRDAAVRALGAIRASLGGGSSPGR